MICCASPLLVLGVLVGAADTVPPAAVAREVTSLLAAGWDVDPATLVVRWGPWPGDTTRHAGAAVRLMAAPGRDGWVTVQVLPPTGSPVAVQLRVGVQVPVFHSTRALAPGHQLVATDLTPGVEIQWGTPRAAALPVGVGWEVRRAIAVGGLLAAPAVAPPIGARAGERVVLVWSRGEVQVEVEAEAMATARIGETVRARRGTTQYTGTLTAPGFGRLDGRRPA